MLQMEHVSKRYGAFEAVRDVSLTLERGQVLGFLGRNGAGKSTTMNILTGCLAPTEGRVLWQGQDTRRLGAAYLAQVGYLPETPPLYPELTVEEYMQFVCGIKKIRRAARPAHIRDVCRRVDIEDRMRKPIRTLSKGYRQRLGIAQALVGDPPLLVLDEPTVGLDPEQMVLIRELIRDLGREHAVLLSSHILSEIEDVCTRLVILRHGRVVAEGTMAEISAKARGESCRVRVRFSGNSDVLKNAPGFLSLTQLEQRELGFQEAILETREDVAVLVPRLLESAGGTLRMLYPMDVELEDVFLKLTAEEAETDAQRDQA